MKKPNEDILRQFRNILLDNPFGEDITPAEYDGLDVPHKPSRSTLRRNIGRWQRAKTLALNYSPNKEKTVSDFSEDKGTIETNSARIKTLEDALEYAEVNLDVWDVERYIVNKWEVGAKLPDANGDKRLVVEPLYQVKVWLKRKIPSLHQKIIDNIFDRMEHIKPHHPKPKLKKYKEPHLIEVALYDHHFGKLAWAEETGEDYDISIATRIYDEAVVELLRYTSGYDVDKILYVIGQDFFHVNNAEFTTAKGTEQDVDSRFPKIFAAGYEAVIDAIKSCLHFAPIDVIWVPGNHDRETSYFLAHSLRAYFKDSKHVNVDLSPKKRKYYQYGNNLIGFTHGNEEPHRDLPAIMAAECRDIWSQVDCCEWHIGHTHKRKETKYLASDTFGGISVRTIPSLTGTDAWHYSKGYVKNPRVAEAYLWSKNNGYRGHFSTDRKD